ncbi:MAG: tail fiber domain-containing protein [Bacteriodetes bacterium]|nr:tail fiber domain-containing protein [Bacteroidota bacterium]
MQYNCLSCFFTFLNSHRATLRTSDFGLRTSDFGLRRGVVFLLCSIILSVSMFAQGPNTNPYPTTGFLGLGSANLPPAKLLHLHGAPGLMSGQIADPCIRLSAYITQDLTSVIKWGHIAILTDENSASYLRSYQWDGIGAISMANAGDMIIESSEHGGNLLLGTRNLNSKIVFSTYDNTQYGIASDLTRMVITNEGKVGIGLSVPYGIFDVMLTKNNIEAIETGSRIAFLQEEKNPEIFLFRPDGEFLNPPFTKAASWRIKGELTKFHIASSVDISGTPKAYQGPIAPYYKNLTTLTNDGNFGVNQENPTAKLQVTDGSVLFNGSVGVTPTSGAGTRFMWIPSKAALRTGQLESGGSATNWDSDNIGKYSVAIGNNNFAQSFGSVALGLDCYVYGPGDPETATGGYYTAVGHAGVAIGHGCQVWGFHGVALGESQVGGLHTNGNTYKPQESIAIGNASAWSTESFAFGYNAETFSTGSFAIGTNAKAGDESNINAVNRINSFAFGNNVVSKGLGSFVIGSGTTSSELLNSGDNCLVVGFNSSLASMFVNTNQVGIGTVSPANRFDVNGSASIGYGTTPTTVGTSNSLAVNGKVGIGTASPQEALSITGSGDNNQVVIWSSDQPVADGYDIDLLVENKVLIGQGSFINSTDLLQINGGAIKYTGGSDWAVASDIRYKRDISPFSDGLDKLRKVNPVWFRYNGAMGLKDNGQEVGVIAQDIQKIIPYCITESEISQTKITSPERRYQVDAVDTTFIRVLDYSSPKDDHGHYKYKDSIITKPTKRWVIEPMEYKTEKAPILTYNSNALRYILINSVKELDSVVQEMETWHKGQIVELHSVIDSLRLIITNQEARIARLETQNNINRDDEIDVILEQNNPNPYSNTTTITYYIPTTILGTPQLVVTKSSGIQVLLSFDALKGTPNQQVIDATTLDTGVYVYSLVVQGKVLASKKMIVIK